MRENRPWIIWLTIIAVICFGLGIYLYYSFFRQSKSELIEAIPTDAVFILTLNDNDGFVSSTSKVAPYLNELLVMDALPAYETMRNKLPNGEYDLSVSGHGTDNGVSVLFNMHADKAAFKRLLRALSIDPNNYTAFEGNRIYTYGTNFKSMKFAYFNHIISISPDIELLKRAIVQHAHPKNLFSDKQFKEMYELTEKNKKQNWLIIQPQRYTAYLSSFLKESLAKTMSGSLKGTDWTALQLRFSGNEMFLSGYAMVESQNNEDFEIQSHLMTDEMDLANIYPASADWYTHLEIRRGRDFNLKRLFKDPQTIHGLAPAEIGYFSLRGDSTTYRYVALVRNMGHDPLEVFYNDAAKADSVRAAHPDGIYQTPEPPQPLMKAFAPDSATWFIEKGNALVFAESKEALAKYLASLKSNGPLTKNRLYNFVNEAVASSARMNFVILNEENNPFWYNQLSEKGKASHFGKDLRIFSFSHDDMENGQHLLPVNLYLLF